MIRSESFQHFSLFFIQIIRTFTRNLIFYCTLIISLAILTTNAIWQIHRMSTMTPYYVG